MTEKPNAQVRYVNPDGTLTAEGMKLFLKWIATLDNHEARLVAGGL